MLEQFINASCAPLSVTELAARAADADAESNLTIGGSVVGSPN